MFGMENKNVKKKVTSILFESPPFGSVDFDNPTHTDSLIHFKMSSSRQRLSLVLEYRKKKK